MRLALLLFAGCGRIAFDATVAGDASAVDGDVSLPAQPLTCEGAFSPLAVPVAANADLAVGVLSSGLAIGFLDRSVPSSPYLAVLDSDQRVAGTPAQLTTATGTSLTTLTGSLDVLFIEVVTGSNHTVLKTTNGITGAMPYDTGTGIAGRDCIVEDVERTEHVGIIADGTTLYASYAQGSAFGTEIENDFGVAITSMHCNPGDDHVHALLATSDLMCHGARITMPAAPTPMFDTIQVEATNCTEPRYCIVDTMLDTGALVWRTSGGGLRTRFVDETATTEIAVAATGTSPRVASDGTNIWFAWADGGQLHVGHRTPATPVTAERLDGVAFAGDEAYELVRVANTVYLVVLQSSPAGLSVYRMCE